LSTIPFNCPSCGAGTFAVTGKTKVETYDDFLGAVCTECGHVVSDKDVKDWAGEIAEDAVKKAFGRFK
jgi:transcription elongation factor Elf1